MTNAQASSVQAPTYKKTNQDQQSLGMQHKSAEYTSRLGNIITTIAVVIAIASIVLLGVAAPPLLTMVVFPSLIPSLSLLPYMLAILGGGIIHGIGRAMKPNFNDKTKRYYAKTMLERVSAFFQGLILNLGKAAAVFAGFAMTTGLVYGFGYFYGGSSALLASTKAIIMTLHKSLAAIFGMQFSNIFTTLVTSFNYLEPGLPFGTTARLFPIGIAQLIAGPIVALGFLYTLGEVIMTTCKRLFSIDSKQPNQPNTDDTVLHSSRITSMPRTCHSSHPRQVGTKLRPKTAAITTYPGYGSRSSFAHNRSTVFAGSSTPPASTGVAPKERLVSSLQTSVKK